MKEEDIKEISSIEQIRLLREVYLVYLELLMIEYQRGNSKEKIKEMTEMIKRKINKCNDRVKELSTDLVCNFN